MMMMMIAALRSDAWVEAQVGIGTWLGPVASPGLTVWLWSERGEASQLDKQAPRVPVPRLWNDSAASSLHKLKPARQPPNLACAETEPET